MMLPGCASKLGIHGFGRNKSDLIIIINRVNIASNKIVVDAIVVIVNSVLF